MMKALKKHFTKHSNKYGFVALWIVVWVFGTLAIANLSASAAQPDAPQGQTEGPKGTARGYGQPGNSETSNTQGIGFGVGAPDCSGQPIPWDERSGGEISYECIDCTDLIGTSAWAACFPETNTCYAVQDYGIAGISCWQVYMR